MMINESDIREAVEFLSKLEMTSSIPQVKTLLNLATVYLNVDGLPEHIYYSVDLLNSYDPVSIATCKLYDRVNATIDLCKVVIARDYVPKELFEVQNMALKHLEEKEKIMIRDYVKKSKFKSLQKLYKRIDKSSNIMARQISLMSDGVPYDEAVKE